MEHDHLHASQFSQVAPLGPGHPRYVFAYLVRIINNREHPIQVLGRSWSISNELRAVVGRIPLAENSIVGGWHGWCGC
jgi:uncharacterized protein affecting Mg2+/Co2+ transport